MTILYTQSQKKKYLIIIYNNIKYISGKEFYKFQFLSQFEIYTGIKSNIDVYNEIESRQYETV